MLPGGSDASGMSRDMWTSSLSAVVHPVIVAVKRLTYLHVWCNASRGLSNARLLLKDKAACLQALDFLVTKHKSRLKTHTSLLHRLAAQPEQSSCVSPAASWLSQPAARTTRRRQLSSRDSSSQSLESRPPWISSLANADTDGSALPMPSDVSSFRAPSRDRDSMSEGPLSSHLEQSQGSNSLAGSGEYAVGSATMEVSSSTRRRPSRPRVEMASAVADEESGLSPSVPLPSSDGPAGGFYCSQLTTLHEQMRALRAENAGLRARLEEAQVLHEGVVGRQGGSLDERRVAMLQAQHIQLQRQVRSKAIRSALSYAQARFRSVEPIG